MTPGENVTNRDVANTERASQPTAFSVSDLRQLPARLVRPKKSNLPKDEEKALALAEKNSCLDVKDLTTGRYGYRLIRGFALLK